MTLESRRTIPRAQPRTEAIQEFRKAARRLPRTPGVYIMRDSLGNPIYVGKAKDLRRRVGSYFAPSAANDSKVSKLLTAISSIHYAETDTELEALLLESRLVKQWLPMFNRDLRQPETMCFLRLDMADALPSIEVVHERCSDGAAYAGPFRSMSFVYEAVEAVRFAYRLRQCSGPLVSRQRACTYGDFGRCSGPCAGHVSANEYRAQALAAWDSLSGRSHDAMDRLIARRTYLVEQFRFEDAYRVQSRIRALEAVGRGRLSAPTDLGGSFVVVVPSASPTQPVLLLFDSGRLAARFACGSRSEPSEAQLTRMLRCLDHPGRDLLPSKPSTDDLLIVHSYLRQHRLESCVLPCPAGDLVERIRAVVARISGIGTSQVERRNMRKQGKKEALLPR